MKSLSKLFLLTILTAALMLAGCRAAPMPPGSEPAEEPAAEAPAEEAADEAAEETTDEPMEEDAMEGGDVESITIGFMGPLTGGAAFIGTEQLGFVQAVAEIYSEMWGIPVTVVEGDTEINPDTGRIVAERFAADESMIGVVGPAGSQVCEAVQPIFADGGLAHITPSCTAIPLTDPGTDTFFRPIPTDADQSTTIATYMLDILGITGAYLVDDQSTYSVGLNDEVETFLSGSDIPVERASVTQDETDFSSVVTSIIASGADVVLFPAQVEGQIGTLAVQLAEQGYEGTYFLADGGFSLGWVDAAGEAADGALVTFFSPDPNLVPEAAEMNAKFVELTGTEEFGAFGGAAGLSAQVLMEAIGSCVESGTADRACVVDAMTNIDLENTVLGIPISFGEGNQADGSFSIFQVEDGQFNLLD